MAEQLTEEQKKDRKFRDQVIACETGAVVGGTAGAFVPLANVVAMPAGAVGGCLVGLGIVELNGLVEKIIDEGKDLGEYIIKNPASDTGTKPQHNLPINVDIPPKRNR